MVYVHQVQPRMFAITPSTFGRRRVIEWQEPPPTQGSRAMFRAAIAQHVLAFQVRDTMLAHEHRTEDAVFDMPMSRHRLGRLLRGDLAMNLAETFALQTYIDSDLLIDLADRPTAANWKNVRPFGART